MRRALPVVSLALALVLGLGCAGPPEGSGEDGPPARDLSREEVGRAIFHLQIEQARAGEYACCVSPGCTMCAVGMGHCPCKQRLAAGESVCGECAGGWDAGRGRVTGFTADDVRPMNEEEARELYEGLDEAIGR